MSERTFTEEEVAALFRRASELQAEQNSKGVQRGSAEKAGLTIDEVSAIAAEAGLDPDHVRRAAAEMNRSAIVDQRGKSSVRDTEIFAERRVPVSIGEKVIEDIVAELRHRYDTSAGAYMGMSHYGESTTQSVGRSVEWKHTNLSGIETRVLLQPRDDHFRVRVSKRSKWGGMTNWTPWAVTFVLIAGVLSAVPLDLSGMFVGLAMLLAAILLLRELNSRWVEKKRREVEELADSIADQVLRAGPTEAASVPFRPDLTEAGPAVETPEAGPERSGSAPTPRRRTR